MDSQAPIAVVEIGGRQYDTKQHHYVSDVLRLGDEFAADIPIPSGKAMLRSGGEVSAPDVAHLGDLVRLYVSDPAVSAGKLTLKMTGRVTGRQLQGNSRSGHLLRVQGADLGWHLMATHGKPLVAIQGLTYGELLRRVLDPSWGFSGVRTGNAENLRLKLGRTGINLHNQRISNSKGVKPRLQIEVGQSISDVILRWAKLAGYLVNVSADGWLQFFSPQSPQSGGKALYGFHRHAAVSGRGQKNNVLSASLRESIDGLYTDVECWTTIVTPPEGDKKATDDPNYGRYHGAYHAPKTLPFKRLQTFSDPDCIGKKAVDQRAKWQWQRGQFQAWTYEATVPGHSQDGLYYEPDTLCTVDDSIYGVKGTFYISSVRYNRQLARTGADMGGESGTTTTLTIKPAGMLYA